MKSRKLRTVLIVAAAIIFAYAVVLIQEPSVNSCVKISA